MSRFVALLLGASWLVALGSVDVAIFARADLVGRHLDEALSEVFVSAVDPGEADFEDGGVVIRGARLMRPGETGAPYAVIGRIRVVPDWTALLAFRTRLTKIVIEDVELFVAWDDTGALDMPSPFRTDVEPSRRPDSSELPKVEVRGLSFQLDRCPWLVEKRTSMAFPAFEVVLRPDGSEHWLYRFAATLGGGVLGDLAAEGRIGVDDVVLSLRREGFRPDAKLIETLKPEFAAILRDVRLEGAMRFSAELKSRGGDGRRTFAARLDLDGVSASHTTFAVGVADLRGRIEYEDNRIVAKALTASFEGGFLEVGGVVEASGDPTKPPIAVSGKLSGLRLSPELGDRVATLPDPCPTVGEQIRQWDPSGVCDVIFSVEQKRFDKPVDGRLFDIPRPKIDVEFRGDANIAFAGGVKEDGARRGFRYRLGDVRGALHFTDLGMSFDGVTARAGPLSVEARGVVGYERENDETYDVDVVARDMPLDDKVAEALAGPGRELFESLDAEGRVDLRISVKRAKGEPPGPRLVVDADLLGIRLEPRPFPLLVEDVRGEVRIDDDRISIRSLRGRHGGGVVRVFDSFLGQGDHSETFRIVAEVERVPIGDRIRRALGQSSPETAKALERLGIEGVVGGKTTVERDVGKPVAARGYVTFEKTSLRSEDPPFRATDGSGAVEFDGASVRIAPGTRLRFAEQPVAVHGTASAAGAFDLVFEGARLVATPRLWAEIELLSPKLAAYASPPLFLGPFEAEINLRSDGENLTTVVRELVLNGVSASPPGSGVALDEVRATVSMTEEGAISASGISARAPWGAGASTIAAPDSRPRETRVVCESLAYDPPRPGENAGSLTFGPGSISNAPLSPWLYDLLTLPEDLRGRLIRAGLGGVVDLDFATVRRSPKTNLATGVVARVSDFRAGASLAAGRLDLIGRRSSDRRSAAGFDVVVRAEGGFDMKAETWATDVSAFDVLLPKLSGALKLSNEGFELSKIEADALGYRPLPPDAVEGEPRTPIGRTDYEATQVSFTFESGEFNVSARLTDVDAPEIVRSRGGDPGAVRGTVACSVDLAGVAGVEETYRGTARMRADLRKAVDLPFFFQLFKRLDVLTFFQSSDPPTKVSATFKIADRMIESRDVEVDSRDVVLRGGARLRFDGFLRADLDASYAAGVLPWTWLMSALSGALAPGVVIEGPLSDLQFRVESAKPETPLPPETRPASGPASKEE